MASFVSARLLSGFLRNLAMQRVDVDALIGDLPIEWSGDERARGTSLVHWNDVAELAERLERRLGGPAALEDLGASIVASRPMPAIRRSLGWTASPHTLYRIGLRWLELHMPRDIRTRLTGREDGRIEIEVAMPVGSRSSHPLLHMLAGAARGLPSVVGLPESVVDTDIRTHGATFVVTPATSGTLLSRLLRMARALLGSRQAIDDLEEERHLLRRHVDQLEQALFETSEREQRLRTLFEAGHELLLEVAEHGRIETASESAHRVTGYDPGQIVGSHLSLWFHRDDDERIRSLLARAFAGEEVLTESALRARHERGRWLDTTLEVRRGAAGDAPRTIIVAVHEVTPEHAGSASATDLALRLRNLERRHRDLREMHVQLLDAERVAATREVADLIENAVGAAIGPLAESLDFAAHVQGAAHPGIARLADVAHRIDDGLTRTVATLRRAKQDRMSVSSSALARSLRRALCARLEGDGTGGDDPRVHFEPVTVTDTVLVDRELVGAAFEHVAEHLAAGLERWGHVHVRVDRESNPGRVRLALEATRSRMPGEPDGEIEFDLELARGILRGQGGNVVALEGEDGRRRLEISFPLESRR